MEMNLCFGVQEKWYNNRKCVVDPSRFLIKKTTGLVEHDFVLGHQENLNRDTLMVCCASSALLHKKHWIVVT
jgi:hypothetical protein